MGALRVSGRPVRRVLRVSGILGVIALIMSMSAIVGGSKATA